MNKTFILVWIYGGKAWPCIQGSVRICQIEKKKLKLTPSYCKGKLVIRTVEGFKENPMWEGKSPAKNKITK